MVLVPVARTFPCPFSDVCSEQGARASYLPTLRQGFPSRIVRTICTLSRRLLNTVCRVQLTFPVRSNTSDVRLTANCSQCVMEVPSRQVMRSEGLGWKREWINDRKQNKITRNCTQYSLAWVFYLLDMLYCNLSSVFLLLVCVIVVSWPCVLLLVGRVYCCSYLVCICCTVCALLFLL